MKSMIPQLFWALGWLSFLPMTGWGQSPVKPQMWYGVMDAGPRIFRFVISAQLDGSGSWNATLTSVDEGGQNFRLDSVRIDEAAFEFELQQTKAKYVGTIQPTSDSSTSRPFSRGRWLQSGAEFELNFEPVNSIPMDSPDEVWTGDLKVLLQTITLQFRVYEAGKPSEQVLVDSVSQFVGGFKATRQFSGEDILIDVPALNGKFNGRQKEGVISGTWSQSVPLNLELRRIDKPMEIRVSKPNRPQTPTAPFAYTVEQVSFESQPGVQLAGTLTIPPQDDLQHKSPVAVLVSGSGPQDRDETILEHKPFWVIADHLTRHGIAVLRYDDRGVAESTGDFEAATTQDFARDAAAAVQFLRKDERFDKDRIGVIGHSEGGLVAPLVAAADPRLDWIILLAGPGVNGREVLLSQGALIVEAEGGTSDMIAGQRTLQEVVLATVEQLTPGESTDPLVNETVQRLIERLRAIESADAVGSQSAGELSEEDLSTFKSQVRVSLRQLNTPWFRFFIAHEPGPVLQQVKCRVLAMTGQYDLQVDPKLNLPAIEASLREGGNTDYQIVEIPGLNHLFQTTTTGKLSEYEKIEETFSPAALKMLSDWIPRQP